MKRKGIVITPSDLAGTDWPERMRSLGLDTLGLHSGGGPAHDVLAQLDGTLSEEFRRGVAEAGLALEYELHVPLELMPRRYFGEHPEYFIQPRRAPGRVPEGNWCSAEEAALEVVGRNAAHLGRKLAPSTRRHFFWGEDSVDQAWCHCDSCAHLTPAEQCLLGVNAMARELAKDDPGARVAFLAYTGTLDRPRQVRPLDNVFLEFAPFERCFRHAIDDPGCSVNRRLWNALLDLLEVFDSAEAHVLEYWLDSSMSSGWKKPARKPPFERKTVERDLQAYARLGITSITTFAVYMDGDYFDRHGDRELLEYAELINNL